VVVVMVSATNLVPVWHAPHSRLLATARCSCVENAPISMIPDDPETYATGGACGEEVTGGRIAGTGATSDIIGPRSVLHDEPHL
jgi:hypothetical protein